MGLLISGAIDGPVGQQHTRRRRRRAEAANYAAWKVLPQIGFLQRSLSSSSPTFLSLLADEKIVYGKLIREKLICRRGALDLLDLKTIKIHQPLMLNLNQIKSEFIAQRIHSHLRRILVEIPISKLIFVVVIAWYMMATTKRSY